MSVKLTNIQKKAIKKAIKENDYCVTANRKTMNSIVKKGLARFSSGFGFRFGGIIELTDEGKKIHYTL